MLKYLADRRNFNPMATPTNDSFSKILMQLAMKLDEVEAREKKKNVDLEKKLIELEKKLENYEKRVNNLEETKENNKEKNLKNIKSGWINKPFMLLPQSKQLKRGLNF